MLSTTEKILIIVTCLMCELSLFSWQLHLQKATLDQILHVTRHVVNFHRTQFYTGRTRLIKFSREHPNVYEEKC